MKALCLLLIAISSNLFSANYNDFEESYIIWREKRLDCIVDFYGTDWFVSKKVLELGCGHGHISAELQKLGAIVTCSDGRAEHGPIIEKKFPRLPFICHDCDSKSWPFDDKYDLIIHMGLLYHLQDPEYSIKQVCKHCNNLVIETTVMDHYDEHKIVFRTEKGFDQGIHNIGSFFSEYFVERCLNESGFYYLMVRGNRCNYYCWTYDYKATGDNKHFRRMWFCKAR